MNRKLIVLLSASILTVAATGTFTIGRAAPLAPTTQPQKTPREALERVKAALEKLDLTADQKEKIKSIFTEARGKLQALKGEGDGKGEAREIIQQARKDILAVLTTPQKLKLREILRDDSAEAKT